MFQSTQQKTGGLFGSSGQPVGGGSLLGASVFGAPAAGQSSQSGSNIFTKAQPPQQQPGGIFGVSNPQPQVMPWEQALSKSSLWQPNSAMNPREKSIPDQIKTILDQWDTSSPSCAFQHYFYNKVPLHTQEYFRPGPADDPKKWEEALKAKPGADYVPVLCVGFTQLQERLAVQAKNLAVFNSLLHQINKRLGELLHHHEVSTSIRAMDAKRKHTVLKRRCLVLATKVQVLRSRGYAMGGDEEDLKAKLVALENSVSDPGLDARQEEIWARMVTVQERVRLLKSELEKSSQPTEQLMDDETTKRAQKILEDYQTQLIHLKKELDAIQKDYLEWEKEQGPAASGR
ncbi:Nuclear pore NUP57 [Hyphodiscus hymeniophilus]|uniref:Nuclear pore NUP57 n=1 Tax=Hyphodiscus hymeniophilus TaxID=353542 RepID=A0A9P6SK65_9HELO|nr:Nuclear pore NUP57 [Hyphodiscus hymeniophilus]